jgi:hypothetical protein
MTERRTTFRPISNRRSQTRPPRLRSIPVMPKGPKLYQQKEGAGLFSGPNEPPPGFLTYTNSRSEWWVYWALAKALGQPKDPRRGPYEGWPGLWTYQSPFEGGRVPGGQVVDFVVFAPATASGDIAIRIQTERYHVMTDAAKQATDRILLARLAGRFHVVDIFEQDFMGDPSGQAAVIEVKRALFGGQTSNPLRSGQARRLRS